MKIRSRHQGAGPLLRTRRLDFRDRFPADQAGAVPPLSCQMGDEWNAPGTHPAPSYGTTSGVTRTTNSPSRTEVNTTTPLLKNG